jgi:hypothetical protein
MFDVNITHFFNLSLSLLSASKISEFQTPRRASRAFALVSYTFFARMRSCALPHIYAEVYRSIDDDGEIENIDEMCTVSDGLRCVCVCVCYYMVS